MGGKRIRIESLSSVWEKEGRKGKFPVCPPKSEGECVQLPIVTLTKISPGHHEGYKCNCINFHYPFFPSKFPSIQASKRKLFSLFKCFFPLTFNPPSFFPLLIGFQTHCKSFIKIIFELKESILNLEEP